MKFRRFACLMTILVLCCVQLGALGEKMMTQGVSLGDWNEAYQAFLKANPNVAFAADNEYYGTMEPFLHALDGNRPDLFTMSTAFFDCQAIMEKSYCADLSQSEAVKEALSRMHAPIREQLMRDGKVYGIPTQLSFSAFSWCKDAWDAAGLSEAEVPATYSQLLDFLESWIIRIKAKPMEDISIENMFDETLYGKGTYVQYLLGTLMDCYILQCEYAGEAIRFDTPEFRELLMRTKTVGEALFEAEPRQKGKMRLFSNTLTGWSYQEIDDGLSHVIPMRITEDQPALIKAQVDMLCVGANGGQPELALNYLENAAQHMDEYAKTFAFTDSVPLERTGLESDIADQQARVAQTKRKLEDPQLDTTARARLERDLSRQTQVLQEIQTEEWRYLVSLQWLEDYKAHAYLLYFPPPGIFGGDTQSGRDMRQLIAGFADGSVSADAFVQGMDQLAKVQND
jgi:hypothetical protein